MWFAIISEDIKDSLALRQKARPAHLERLNELNSQSRLLVAGPHPLEEESQTNQSVFSGSLVIAEFNCLEEAQAWADADPYVDAGVYKKVTVKPFKKVLP